jgi:hypothetical protein
VDLDAPELYVMEQLQRVKGQLLRRATKTEADGCATAAARICVAALRFRGMQQDRERERYAERWTEIGLVFTTRYGTPIEPRNFNRSFDYRIAKAGVRRITVHGTRKTCVTLLAALDVHPRVAMQILRHSQIAVTMEIYTEVTSETTRTALKRLGDELSPPVAREPDDFGDVELQAYKADREHAADNVAADVREYLKRNGWVEQLPAGPAGSLRQRGRSQLAVFHQMVFGSPQWEGIITRLGQHEQRPAADVSSSILGGLRDMLQETYCCTLVLYGMQKRPAPLPEPASDLVGRYWDRTSDLFGVNEARSRCANRPSAMNSVAHLAHCRGRSYSEMSRCTCRRTGRCVCSCKVSQR